MSFYAISTLKKRQLASKSNISHEPAQIFISISCPHQVMNCSQTHASTQIGLEAQVLTLRSLEFGNLASQCLHHSETNFDCGPYIPRFHKSASLRFNFQVQCLDLSQKVPTDGVNPHRRAEVIKHSEKLSKLKWLPNSCHVHLFPEAKSIDRIFSNSHSQKYVSMTIKSHQKHFGRLKYLVTKSSWNCLSRKYPDFKWKRNHFLKVNSKIPS